ncbi:UNVERIFIED_ORG: hypothetical protein GGI57_006391 [Rhizobium aethiopicum]|nr:MULTISPECIES: hypothetical protein [Rhizobium]ANM13871.1 hypothetical protein AMK05_PC00357 [Rhizobium sp. N324]ANM20250.1 hypothetical protein AMK06_PC100340 [Rhizobium sp. N541]ANM26635.1 hypothetical protein AMK07_PC100340 [Rhizobium sp. N941]ARM91475.1 hypothetical protein RHEC894_PC00457 [Rhizobium sp. CIAT894]OYD00903.1 hypothetical protein AMK08_PC00356 [Rhizobium sp. N4311]
MANVELQKALSSANQAPRHSSGSFLRLLQEPRRIKPNTSFNTFGSPQKLNNHYPILPILGFSKVNGAVGMRDGVLPTAKSYMNTNDSMSFQREHYDQLIGVSIVF